MKKIIFAALMLIPSFSTAADCPVFLLPTAAPVEAKVMQIGMKESVQQTLRQMQDALVSQPEWAREFITANDRPGQPLPYHPNLKVTPEDYQAMLAAKPTLIQVGTISLIAERLPKGEVRLKTDDKDRLY